MSITNTKGMIGETAFLYQASLRGYLTAQMPQDCSYDVVLDKGDGVVHRVQCKYCTIKDGRVKIKITGSHPTRRTYTKLNVDFISVYVADTQEVYLIPSKDFDGMVDISFRILPSKNGQQARIRPIEQYKNW